MIAAAENAIIGGSTLTADFRAPMQTATSWKALTRLSTALPTLKLREPSW